MASNDGSFPDDGNDDAISMIDEDSLSSTPSGVKRKFDKTNGGEKRVKFNDNFTTALVKKLTDIDASETLEVFKYIHTVNSDPVVKDYVDKLLVVQFMPTIPTQEEFKTLPEKKTVSSVTESCSAMVVSLLMYFLQSRYFSNNMGEAIKNKKSVINVKADLHMPGFRMMPETFFAKLTSLKQSFAIQVQSLSHDASMFFQEHLLIDCAHHFYKDLKGKVNDEGLSAEITAHFDIHFVKAHTEFMKTFNIKDIDWKTFEDRVRYTCPLWRRRKESPPIPQSFFAKNIVSRILEKKESFDPITVKKEFDEFMENGEACVQRIQKNFNQKRSFHRKPPQTPIVTSKQGAFQYQNHSTPSNFDFQKRKSLGVHRNRNNHHNNPHQQHSGQHKKYHNNFAPPAVSPIFPPPPSNGSTSANNYHHPSSSQPKTVDKQLLLNKIA